MHLRVNEQDHDLAVEPERMLLGVIRHELGLTGTKYGCGEGNCGACTVLVDGEATRSCITPVAAAAGRAITTIEGLANGDQLHPVQAAFADESAFQCGYCTPGFIMSSVALLARNPRPTRDEVKSALNGHICRCGAYVRILRAVDAAASRPAAQTAPANAVPTNAARTKKAARTNPAPASTPPPARSGRSRRRRQ